jgi:hypothetical protein
MIMDSKWFRNAFSDFQVQWKDLGILFLQGTLEVVTEFIEQVCTMTLTLGRFVRQGSTTEDIMQSGDFDAFMQKWYRETLLDLPDIPRIMQRVSIALQRGLSYGTGSTLSRHTVENPPFQPLCIPRSLAEKLVRVGSIRATLLLTLQDALRRLRNKQTFHQPFRFDGIHQSPSPQ